MEGPTQVSWAELAEKTWGQPSQKPKRARLEVIKTEIWDTLEKENFDYRSLLALDSLQLLEKYLWPAYTDDASDYHVLLIALMVGIKRREGLPIWSVFSDRPGDFSSLFRRLLSMSVDDSVSIRSRNSLLAFVISAFQSLDNGIVRKECAPLVSIAIWHNLSSDAVREEKFGQSGQLRKAWRAASRRMEAADPPVKARLHFERNWLYSMIMRFVQYLNSPERLDLETLVYCERFVEFLVDLESQLPTRRYVNTLIHDLNLVSLIRLSPALAQDRGGLLGDLFSLLRHFVTFTIDDQTGAQLTEDEVDEARRGGLAKLQRTALKSFKSKLTILALSNHGAIEKRADLESHLSPLEDSELLALCTALGFRTRYLDSANITLSRELMVEILLSKHERQRTFQEVVMDLNTLPTEADLYDPSLLRNESYDGSRSLAIPKLNLQYLTVGDFLWRSFILYRCESFFEIRKDLEETIKRLRPRTGPNGSVVFDGFSPMALPIDRPSIMEEAPPLVGFDEPAFVRAEISLDISRLSDHVLSDWDRLRPDDVVYMVSVKPQESMAGVENGVDSTKDSSDLRRLRIATVVQVLDESGTPLRDVARDRVNGHGYRPRSRRLLVDIDAVAFAKDKVQKTKGKSDVYESINLLIRRRGRENNFKKILASIKRLTLSDVPVPGWLREVFLGYGDPTSASYKHLAKRLQKVDFRDTFLDLEHLEECLPSLNLQPDRAMERLKPPFVLETLPTSSPSDATAGSQKRRRDRTDVDPRSSERAPVRISTYELPNSGPYPTDVSRSNKIRFTPSQVAAIASGTQPGLTIIVGPPGTGKTDVATQIISNIYHDFPDQRTLLVAHSNQALNQLFQKITKLDIDDRHLLRLGHGEEELDTEVNYGKYGRVESFLDNRGHLLADVDRLAQDLGAPGAHGASCETAGYFNSVYVQPAWAQFWDAQAEPAADTDVVISAFPFHQYFATAPQPLFPPDASMPQVVEIARGCQRHIERLFSELEDIRPFEILRSSRDKANYLLIKEARIVAMTSTHAAMRRQEIADLGFHYDNVIMEEAAQITEIENFIPFALQNPTDGQLPLQRIVLCGDHLQNSPIIQNLAFRQFANLGQSLFLRMVRLGVPAIHLDQQGRARPSIAELYKWRYGPLGDLPHVVDGPEYVRANAGFRYDYQFIDVADYQGAGEKQPTPHFIQNLGEAEYSVALFQYMRLLGYPAAKISILTTYAGQRALIRDVLGHRCARNRLFGLPKIVTTVDKYQGEQNDYIILSLVRTSRVGYLRDVRRLTVALSRARLGLYIVGRQDVFAGCYELREGFDRLLRRPTALMLVAGEMFPTQRRCADEVPGTPMVGVEHLGQYVYEMTQARLRQMGLGDGVMGEEEETAHGAQRAGPSGVLAVEAVGELAMEKTADGDKVEEDEDEKGGDDDEAEEEEVGFEAAEDQGLQPEAPGVSD